MKRLLLLLTIILVAVSISCNNESIDTSTISAEEVIGVNSELYNKIERIADKNPEDNLVCIDFIYAFTINIFDENLDYVGFQIVSSDLEFSAFLGILQSNYSISVSYPITSTTNDGEIIEITNNEELKEIIDNCIKEEIILSYSELLTKPHCIWKVIHNEDGNNDFENAYFDVSNTGSASFFYEDIEYFGTWILFFIEDELHLNISLDDDTNIGENWNFDWKIKIIDENIMMLENGDRTFFIQKECDLESECKEFKFEVCELTKNEGIAEFYLEDYIECIANFIEYEINENTIITFHENPANEENNTNPLPTSPFLNSTNPQYIDVKFVDSETGEFVFTSIELTAIQCE